MPASAWKLIEAPPVCKRFGWRIVCRMVLYLISDLVAYNDMHTYVDLQPSASRQSCGVLAACLIYLQQILLLPFLSFTTQYASCCLWCNVHCLHDGQHHDGVRGRTAVSGDWHSQGMILSCTPGAARLAGHGLGNVSLPLAAAALSAVQFTWFACICLKGQTSD